MYNAIRYLSASNKPFYLSQTIGELNLRNKKYKKEKQVRIVKNPNTFEDSFPTNNLKLLFKYKYNRNPNNAKDGSVSTC